MLDKNWKDKFDKTIDYKEAKTMNCLASWNSTKWHEFV